MASSNAPDAGGTKKTWVIVGASRGIGHEFVQQLLVRGDRVIATVRGDTSSFWPKQKESCQVQNCDVSDEKSIDVRPVYGTSSKWLQISLTMISRNSYRSLQLSRISKSTMW